ncbi:MAG: fluoride efflux transporter CrcB [Luteitalea sp.]|nr:fluoride efflux transporter CrcB [Luteitalea sp.]
MRTWILIAVGGALGAAGRYALAGFVMNCVAPFFPWGTFVVNLLGCFLFGVTFGLAEERFVLGPSTRVFLLIGLLGGFTTFSSFSFESLQLLRDGEMGRAAFNAVGQVVGGVAALWLGLTLTRLL